MENRCIYCGDIIPEGKLVCWQCEHEILSEEVSEYDNARSCERIDEACE